VDLIKEKGYDSVTLNDICTAASISKNTFYYYFKSKEELLLQFYSTPMDAIISNLTSILMEENSVDQFWKLIEPMLDFIVENGTEITKRMLFALTNQNIDPYNISGFRQDRNDVGVKIIERAQSSGEIINSSDPVLLFNNVQAQTIGVIIFWCTQKGEFDFKNAVRLAIEVCLDVKPELRKASPSIFAKS
jgi:hypothetical protein